MIFGFAGFDWRPLSIKLRSFPTPGGRLLLLWRKHFANIGNCATFMPLGRPGSGYLSLIDEEVTATGLVCFMPGLEIPAGHEAVCECLMSHRSGSSLTGLSCWTSTGLNEPTLPGLRCTPRGVDCSEPAATLGP